MPKTQKEPEEMLREQLKECDDGIAELVACLSDKRQRRVRIQKALKALIGRPASSDGRIAPTLKHCQKAGEILFGRKHQWEQKELAQQLTAALASHPQLNKQGLSLRVAQYLKACPRHEQSSLLIAPNIESQS